MITKGHIKKYLQSITPDVSHDKGPAAAYVWRQFHEYVVEHYKRLDKEARIFADTVFDELDLAVQQRVESLLHGRRKTTLKRKLAMLRGDRPSIPLLYLDTPIVEDIIRSALGQHLSGTSAQHTKALYVKIRNLVKQNKLLCPENTFHREAIQLAEPHAGEGLDVIRTLSGGLSFKHAQMVEDAQVFRAIRAFIEGQCTLNYRSFWKDVVTKRTVMSIMKNAPFVVFDHGVTIAQDNPEEFRQEGPLSSRLRIRYDEASLRDEQDQLKRSARHLRDLVRLGNKYRSITQGNRKRPLDGFWAVQKTDLSIILWNNLGGKPQGLEGLTSLYESDCYATVPMIKIKRDIWNMFSANSPETLKRIIGPSDIAVLSAVLPYADIMILGPTMAKVVRNSLKLDAVFDTQIFSVQEHDAIMAALDDLPRAA